MRKEWFISIGAMVLAFLGSQHHNLHMLLLSIGLGGSGGSLMTTVPLVRRAMLLLSLAMVAVIGYQMRDGTRPRSMRLTGAISIIVTLGLTGWSIMQFGF
ncbi:MAG: hypothetical protein O3A85_11735 [Proteobacteria bacterium]|nr:hypothetical protein [Pseudomonadota bacterium]